MPRQQNGDTGWITPKLPPYLPEEQSDEPIRHWKVVRIYWVQTADKRDAITFAQEGYIEPQIEFAVIEPSKGWFAKLVG